MDIILVMTIIGLILCWFYMCRRARQQSPLPPDPQVVGIKQEPTPTWTEFQFQQAGLEGVGLARPMEWVEAEVTVDTTIPVLTNDLTSIGGLTTVQPTITGVSVIVVLFLFCFLFVCLFLFVTCDTSLLNEALLKEVSKLKEANCYIFYTLLIQD